VTEEVRELAALYALGALTQHEARSFEIHLREGCPSCEAELRRYERTAAGMGFTAEEIDIPEYVRDLLLARIDREPSVSVSVDSSNLDEPALKAFSPIDDTKTEPPKPRSKFGWGLWIVFIALVIIILWTLHSLKITRESSAQQQVQLSASQAKADDLQKKLNSQKEKPGDIEQILQVAGKPGVRVARLAGQSPAPASSGVLYWDAEQHRYWLMGSFPPAPQGRSYQLWLVTPSAKVSAGLIKVNPDGPTLATAPITENAPNATAAGITLEPGSGSPAPTTRFYALGHFN
jgi:anti-sigma-K factor RskA